MAAKIGANPFTQAQIEQMKTLVQIAHEVSVFLGRCQNCGLSVAHLQQQVQGVHDTMQALATEFGSDAN